MCAFCRSLFSVFRTAELPLIYAIIDGHAEPVQEAEEGQAHRGQGLEGLQGQGSGTVRFVLVGRQRFLLDPASTAPAGGRADYAFDHFRRQDRQDPLPGY